MKKLIVTIVSVVALCASVKAQNTNTGAAAIWTGLQQSGLLSATNYAFEPYGTYAPSAPQGRKWGGGLLAIYNVNDYAGLGIGGDFLGQFTLVSGNATLQLPIAPFSGLTNAPSVIQSLKIVPFGLIGVGSPLSGSADKMTAITDMGAAVKFGHLWGGQFNAGYSYGRWDNAGQYSGVRHHLFLGWSYGF